MLAYLKHHVIGFAACRLQVVPNVLEPLQRRLLLSSRCQTLGCANAAVERRLVNRAAEFLGHALVLREGLKNPPCVVQGVSSADSFVNSPVGSASLVSPGWWTSRKRVDAQAGRQGPYRLNQGRKARVL
ncbi:hypothetical protein SUDANB145_02209 [Streptomyces sp. enrichment culture]